MLEPREIDLFSYIGADYYDIWEFWHEDNPTLAYDFTGWTQFTLVLSGLTFTEGSGLTIDRANGTVAPAIPRSTTGSMRPGTASYALSAIDENGNLGFLMLGVFEWKRAA